MNSKLKARLDAIRGLAPTSGDPLLDKDIRDLGTGSYLQLDDEVFRVQRVFRYLDVKWSNFKLRNKDYWVTELELFSLHSGKLVWLEWEFDDELEIYRTTENVRLRSIQFGGHPLRQDDLEYIADEEQGVVEVGSRRFEYSEEDTWAGRFFTVDQLTDSVEKESGTPLRVYEFEANDGTSLSVEAWHEDDDDRPEREAFISQKTTPDSVAVLQIG